MEVSNSLAQELNPFEANVVEFFCDGVRMIGLPRSIGEIYGLLFVSKEPLSLDDLVSKLNISKGTASQGLKMLRELGAVKDAEGEIPRRSYFTPDIELKQLVGGFIKEQVRPHLASGEDKLDHLKEMLTEIPAEDERSFYQARLERLGGWSKKARIALPLIQKILGS